MIITILSDVGEQSSLGAEIPLASEDWSNICTMSQPWKKEIAASLSLSCYGSTRAHPYAEYQVEIILRGIAMYKMRDFRLERNSPEIWIYYLC
jgi:hypothetical protein